MFASGLAAQEASEAKRVRVLIAVDTHDKMGLAWGIDGMNMKAILEGTLKKQNLDKRLTVELFTGKQVTPENILAYFDGLGADPDEALVFYFSGHGGTHRKRGHFMALHYGNLFRKDLIAAMKKNDPRLMVLLTDCCANFAGGAKQEEPKGTLLNLALELQPTRPKAKRQEPPSKVLRSKESRPTVVPRPDIMPERQPNAGAPTKMILQTGKGPLALDTILKQTNGEVMRHLMFRQSGLVDINGCAAGAFSMGTPQWGGSLFTIAFMELQQDKLNKFDKNGNQLIEWDEFFPHLQTGTRSASRRMSPGTALQVPEAIQLGGARKK